MTNAKKRDAAAFEKRLEKLSADALLALYADLLADDPHMTQAPSRALRNKARDGDLAEDYIPLLTVALADAPNLSTFTHLTKALAAFGREAQMAAPLIIKKLEDTAVNSDRRFWAFDAAIHALGFLGGDKAKAFILDIKAREPSPMQRSKSVYRGKMSDEQREEFFRRSLEGIEKRLEDENPVWRKRRTQFEATKPEASSGSADRGGVKPWMMR